MDALAQFGGSNASRAWSGTIWGDCPIEALRAGIREGFIWEKQFLTVPLVVPTTEAQYDDDLVGFSSTGGTMAFDTSEIGGGWKGGSDGDDEGASIRQIGQPAKISLANGDFWFEAIVKSSTIADTKHGFFLGMMEAATLTATVPIAAAGTLADQNLFGFHRLEGDGDKVDAVYKANTVTQVTVQADAGTLVADTYTKLGMRFVPKRNIGNGPGHIYWYQDGVQIAVADVIAADGTDFPNDVNVGFVFAILNATASTPGTSTIKKVRYAQLFDALP